MQIQKLSDLNIKNKKLPAKAVVIQLLDKDSNHLAFIACYHEQLFSLFDSDNDRETSHFLEEISNFESEILQEYFRLDKDLEKSFGGWTGELIVTGANSEIIHHEKSA
ncbi:MAG: hypothetical protein ACR2IA_06280 [Pyrinomonadaceae bacterium]